MKIAIKNMKNSNHSICTTDGQKIIIGPKNFTIINTDKEREISYWTNIQNSKALSDVGLYVITDEEIIHKLESEPDKTLDRMNNPSKVYTDVSVADGFVSPVAKEIASSTYKKSDILDTISDTTDSKYSEEHLLAMSKEDLFNICDNFNIKYKRNNSVKTLVKLLIENGVVE